MSEDLAHGSSQASGTEKGKQGAGVSAEKVQQSGLRWLQPMSAEESRTASEEVKRMYEGNSVALPNGFLRS